jgi:hypothetical protein
MADEPQIATERMVIPNPLAGDPNAGIIVAAGDPIPTFEEPVPTSGPDDGFDVEAATGKELDARFGDVDGYPKSAKVDERRAFARAHLEAA